MKKIVSVLLIIFGISYAQNDFSDDLQTVTVDSDGCMRYSGASCGWEGGYKLMKKYK